MIFTINSPKYGEKEILIDDEDYNKIKDFKWCILKNSKETNAPFYVATREKRENKITTLYLHRFIMNCPDNKQVDHVNCNALDNRKQNLRICNQSENSKNQRIRKSNSSGYKGVHWAKKENKWVVQIRINGVKTRIGRSENLKEAALLYNQAAMEYHGVFARLNNI